MLNNKARQKETIPPLMRREDYKAVKHMDKTQMSAYLQRVYFRGYEAGLKAAKAAMDIGDSKR
ncbi:MAG: hypothetical protein HFG44_09265 [Oscillospiraceae bacterium]|nr:hypothetical protein [Oscillospiraceae bacterium]